MKTYKSNVRKVLVLTVVSLALLSGVIPVYAAAPADISSYCVQPPFISQSVPPLVMFDVSRDHKLYYLAYNDGVDLNNDGRIDNTYDHSIEYYGYFNPYKCYTHTGGSASGDYFTPVATNIDRFCASGQWGGNILNWITMSRMDVIRKVMYGGQRSQETPKTVLNRAYIPQDAHSWGKEYTGKVCGSGTTYKQMCTADADCDTGYTCQDKSVNLVGISAPTAGTPCTTAPGFATKNSDNGYHKMLVVRYPNTNGANDTDHNSLLLGYDLTQFFTSFTPIFVDDFNDTNLDPAKDHGNNYAEIVVAEFSTGSSCSPTSKKPNLCDGLITGGSWQFAIDGDDGVELEIRKVSDGNILQTTGGLDQLGWYGGHGASGGQSHAATWTLASSTKYRIIVRHTEASGTDGVKLWYKVPYNGSWTVFGQSSTLDVNAPKIVTSGSSDNTCSLKNDIFRDTGLPSATTKATGQGYHLFCNTTLSSGVPTSSAASQTTLLRMITNTKHRIWEWSLKERPVCGDTFEDNSDATTGRTDYTVQVEVCKSGVGTLSEKNLFERCRNYGGTYNAGTGTYTGGTWKPVGLFQKYGEPDPLDTSGIAKVCTKTMGKACNNDNDCGTGEGLCFDKSLMYFGMMTTTYTKNTSGGVLRKNPGPVSDEVKADGSKQTAENVRGNLIHSMDRMVMIDFNYSSRSYDNCGWIWNRPINEGECKMWGNPLAELLYENMRYFAGKGTPTPEYTYSTPADSGVSLSKPDWGYDKGSTVYKPFEIYPSCAQPFILILSDVNTSYDADQIPGSLYPKSDGTYFAEDAASPQLGLGTVTSGKSLLNQLMDTISTTEGIGGNANTWFIGESGGTTDFICSPKTAANLQSLRGTCPEEPTKKGSYYAAALAYYGRTQFATKTGYSPVSTFVVALSSPFADISIKAGANNIKIVPVAKTVSGCGVDKCLNYSGCTFTTDAVGGMHFSGCPTNGFCPTNSLVGLFINDVKYNSSNEIVYMKFRQNFEDVEQGADHDMDAIATYEVCTATAASSGYGSCSSLSLTGNEFEVLVTSSYASGCADQVLGYIISGTTADGTYLVVRDKDVGSGSPVSGLPLESKIKFVSSSAGSAQNLKDPLWYAAKWGGFIGSGLPDTASKWDKDNDGVPDNYFPVNNPLQLDKQLENALLAILARVSSGTAASILNNSEGSGANLLQAVFYPKKAFDNSTEANWVGEVQNLWYYLDPFFQKTSIREDSDQDFTLNLKTTSGASPAVGDKVTQFFFDNSDNQTKVALYYDNDGDGSADSSFGTVTPDNVKSLWKAGRLLWGRDLSASSRSIKTHFGGAGVDDGSTGFVELSTLPTLTGANATTVETLMQTTAAEKSSLVSYLYGTDVSGFRNRLVTIKSCSDNRQNNCTVDSDCGGGSCNNYTSEWRLGDIISATPKLISNVRLNAYNLPSPNGYGDTSYSAFINTSIYKNRGMVFVGGNDGMMHAFKLGILKELNGKYEKAKMVNASGQTATASDNLGQERWNFIPRNALPYLTYLKDPNYCHLYYIDKTPSTFDASIGDATVGSDACTASSYWDCAKDSSRWKTVLIGGMGTGGACRNSTNVCGAEGCVKTPIADTGFSSYFALDVTDPENPNYLWEFPSQSVASHAAAIGSGAGALGGLGYSTTGPAVIRIAARVKNGSNVDTDTPNNAKNGKWFAVFASGPTGPILNKEFLGKSDQTLKIFIVDLKTGALLRTIDTGITNAFAGSLSSSWVDTDRGNKTSAGYYSDDAVYIGYVQKDTSVTPNTWTKGGVIRLITNDNSKDSLTPANWTWSTVISGTGPVTTSVTKLQDRQNKKFWLYFGTGRYFLKLDDPSTTVQQRLYGIKEPCYSAITNDIDPTCTTTVSNTSADCSGILSNAAFVLGASALCDQSGTTTAAPLNKLPSNASGWFINLDAAVSGSLSERVITDPIASPAGAVFFTSLKPSGDVCKFGGDSLIWAAGYATGGLPPARAMQGKALMQVSTGAFAEISLSTAFSNPGNARFDGRRLATPISGVPPTAQGLSLITNPPAVKKFLHVREK